MSDVEKSRLGRWIQQDAGKGPLAFLSALLSQSLWFSTIAADGRLDQLGCQTPVFGSEGAKLGRRCLPLVFFGEIHPMSIMYFI